MITDSGLGGLSICAALERQLRAGGSRPPVRLTYFNAWPEPGRGYNTLPDIPTRVQAFERALLGILSLEPDLVAIACNTLSVLYEHSTLRPRPEVPILGIVDLGVEMFEEGLRGDPGSGLVLLGTRTTIDAGAHRERLVERGIEPDRISGTSCHGLATAIERGPDGDPVREAIDGCTARAAQQAPVGAPLYVGLCCTHYALVASRLTDALARRTGRTVVPLDPNERMVRDLVRRVAVEPGRAHEPRVDVVSKVRLGEDQQVAMAAVIEPVSPPVAKALRAYRHVPDLF